MDIWLSDAVDPAYRDPLLVASVPSPEVRFVRQLEIVAGKVPPGERERIWSCWRRSSRAHLLRINEGFMGRYDPTGHMGQSMPQDPTRFVAQRIEGPAFAVSDLELALAWAKTQPAIRLDIALDHPSVSEVIEIYQPGAQFARWLIWQTHDGRLRVDDRVNKMLALPYHTVETALAFIATRL